MKKINVCNKCKKESDRVLVNMCVGDKKYLSPGTRIGQWKCGRCGRILDDNEKFFRVEVNE
ncbi:hypothetical protein KJA16_00675 [Patescibacteria group bacterium]|nr:hypothetical protein [Patescibacteria group bacterium]MBZ9578230.1 hypothetical protein [Patescibacteria group bacterium]